MKQHAIQEESSSSILWEAIIFDFGGVLVDWDPWYLYSKIFPDRAEYERFLNESHFQEWIDRADAGESFGSLCEEVRDRTPHWGEAASLFRERFLESIGGVIEGSVTILKDLHRAQIPLYGLTNWSAETFPLALKKYEFFSLFQDILVSGREKLRKPDVRIYELALNRWSLNPARTLFIDDRLVNVEAAQKVGLKTHHFQGPSGLKKILSSTLPTL